MRPLSRRFASYLGAWAALSAAFVAGRFALLAGGTVDQRLPFVVGYITVSAMLIGAVSVYERRRLARATGIRGGLKIAAVEFALDGRRLSPENERHIRLLRRIRWIVPLGFAVGIACLVIP